MNAYIDAHRDLQDFCTDNALVHTIGLLNPTLLLDKTYLHGSKYTDYIFLSAALSELAVKLGHHQFDQYFISDHKGLFVHFRAGDLFDNREIIRSHE